MSEKYFVVDIVGSEVSGYDTKKETEAYLNDLLGNDPLETVKEIENDQIIVIKGKQVVVESFKVKLEE